MLDVNCTSVTYLIMWTFHNTSDKKSTIKKKIDSKIYNNGGMVGRKSFTTILH